MADKAKTTTKSASRSSAGDNDASKVPASMAEQLDPPIESAVSEIGDRELVANPETRGIQRGKDLKQQLDTAKTAEKKAGETSQKQAAAFKSKHEDDESVAETGETIPDAVLEADKRSLEVKEEEEQKLKDAMERNAKDAAKHPHP